MKKGLMVDPDAKLEEELIVRPTSKPLLGYLSQMDSIVPRSALVDQPMGQCGAVGNAYPFVSAYNRISLAGRAYCSCYCRGSH